MMVASIRCGGVLFGLHTLLLISLLFSPAGFAQEKRKFDCKADVRYECTADQCERITEDFQHAESFAYDAKTTELSACLWTNCYSAKTKVFTAKAAGTLTAIGKLVPVVHPKNKPLIVSLTIKISDTDRGASDKKASKDKEAAEDKKAPEDKKALEDKKTSEDKKAATFTAIWGYGGDRLTFDMGSCEVK